jgi:menaquinone-dependent protoporphyrinogen oxidase
MNTLILYASKYGATGDIAKRVAEKIGDAEVYKLGSDTVPPLDGYDCVIVGSSIYAGAIRKEAKAFVTANAETLNGKTLGLFVCGLDGGKGAEYFDANFPAETVSKAKAAMYLGGVFDPKKAGLFDRLAIWMITKQSGRVDKTDDALIDEFAKKMRS